MSARTPRPTTNPPGQTALSWRSGTWAEFRASMLDGVSREVRLSGLATRALDDPAVALMDAFACVLDILSFYGERSINEGFLRTATERRSVRLLAHAIGYQPSPGVAASTLLAFETEDLPTAPEQVVLRAGTPVRTIPRQGELPVVFETSEALEARRGWGSLPIMRRATRAPREGDQVIPLEGVAPPVAVGDLLMIADPSLLPKKLDANVLFHPLLRRVLSLEADPTAPLTQPRTLLTLDEALPAMTGEPALFPLRRRAGLFGANAPEWRILPEEFRKSYAGDGVPLARDAPVRVVADWPEMPLGGVLTEEGQTLLALENEIGGIAPSTPILIEHWGEKGEAPFAGRIARMAVRGLRGFTLSARVTLLLFEGALGLAGAKARRQVVVHLADAPLTLATWPLSVEEARLEGDVAIPVVAPAGMLPRPGRLLALRGPGPTGAVHAESAILASVEEEGDTLSILRLTKPLRHAYRQDALELRANVVAATHGEARGAYPAPAEIVGSGDGGAAFQSFRLRQGPLTFVPAANASGRAAALVVEVNGFPWREVPYLADFGPSDRVFTLRVGEDGKGRLRFGDGITGARLPSGTANVAARYRVGIGLSGRLEAGRLDQLGERPLGLKSVINPVPATGAEEPERLDDARRNAPGSVLTLGRIVSVPDFAHFAAGFAGVGKAAATLLTSGARRLVLLSVAGAEGKALDRSGETVALLRKAVAASRPPGIRFEILPHRERRFRLRASFLPRPGARREAVEASLRAAILLRFGFERQRFGEAVAPSDVLATMQGVEGVLAARLHDLSFTDEDPSTPTGAPAMADVPLLPEAARLDDADGTLAAQILLVDAEGIALEPWREAA